MSSGHLLAASWMAATPYVLPKAERHQIWPVPPVFDILRQKDVEFFYIRNNNLILFHYTDGITDIILHYSIHTICYCVDEEVNYRKDDIIEEV